jgi:hypothetical protein
MKEALARIKEGAAAQDMKKIWAEVEKHAKEGKEGGESLLQVVTEEMQKSKKLGLKAFFYKKGQFSKTAFFLSMTWLLAVLLWVGQSLFIGSVFFGWTVPAFSVESALAMVGMSSGLYFGTHNIQYNNNGKE